MGETAIGLIRAAFERYRERDFDALERILHPDVIAALTVPLGTRHLHQGRREVLAALRDRDQRYADYKAEGTMFTATPNGRVFAEGIASYRPAGGGRGGAQRLYWLYTVRDNMIVRIESFTDRDEALGAGGLSRTAPRSDAGHSGVRLSHSLLLGLALAVVSRYEAMVGSDFGAASAGVTLLVC